jgi:hypothetical protein
MTMTVKELIDALDRFDEECEVYSEHPDTGETVSIDEAIHSGSFIKLVPYIYIK